MATYIKTLKEDNGDTTYPQTTAGAVLLSGGGDLETTLNSKASQTSVDGKISIGDVQYTDLVANSVRTAAIQDLNVTNAKIANLAVQTGKIANGAVTGVANNATAIGSAKLALNTVGTPNLRDDAVTPAKIGFASFGRFSGDLSSGSQSYSAGTAAIAKVPVQNVTPVGATYNTSTGVYTITQPGWWLITGGARAALASSSQGSARIRVNGSNVVVGSGTGYASSSVNTTFNQALAWMGHLAANDTVELAITCSVAMTNSNSATQQHLEGICLMPD